MFTEMNTQRVIRFDDVHQATTQFERMIRDFQRLGQVFDTAIRRWGDGSGIDSDRSGIEWDHADPEGSMLSTTEAAELFSRWNAMAGGDARRNMFNETVDELFQRVADRTGAVSYTHLRAHGPY